MVDRAFIILPADEAGEFFRLVIDGTEIQKLRIADAISDVMVDAAERLFSEWYNSGLAGHGASWKTWNGGSARALVEDMSEQQEISWRASVSALKSIPGYWPRSITEAVVLYNMPCKNTVALRVGLAALAKHYGVI